MVDGTWIPIIAITSLPIMVVGLPIARAYARTMEARSRTPAIPSDVSARLERMEQAIDAVAIRDVPTGRVVHVAHASDYLTPNGWTNANMTKLMSNAVGWVARCQ